MTSASIIFLEIKKDYVGSKGKLDIIGQVLAECAGVSEFHFFCGISFGPS
jgi:hypothetical protein